MKILKAKDYKTRAELENDVRNSFGLTPEKKEAVIQGKVFDLAKLSLSARTIFWGINCEVLQSKSTKKKTKVSRGKKTDFGINNRDNKIKNAK